jgi:tmRNA-binding protein
MTMVPLKIYFNDRGRAKLLLAIARGKKLHDKRETEKQRDWAREKRPAAQAAWLARTLQSSHGSSI